MRSDSLFLAAFVTHALACGGHSSHPTTPTPAPDEASSGNGAAANVVLPPGFPLVRRNTPASSAIVAPDCPLSAEEAIGRLRIHGRAFHYGPVCTTVAGGGWSAIVVTGTPQEATDVWVAVKNGTTVEVHRVRRTPVGVHIAAGTIANGFGYLTGESLATNEMPAGAEVLIEFALPRFGGADTLALDLSVPELALLGAPDRAELTRRVAALATDAPPAPGVASTVGHALVSGGAAALATALPAGIEVPVLRAWETGVYQRLGTIHAGAATPQLNTAAEMIHTLGETVDCTMGDRCLAHPEPAITTVLDASVVTQVLLHRAGADAHVAAVIDQGHRPDNLARPSHDALSAQTYDVAADRELAEALTLDGTVEGRVAGMSRGPYRLVAWGVANGTQHGNAVYVIPPGRAPRRFEDSVLAGLTTGTREMYFRDVDRQGEPEVVSIAQTAAQEAVAVSTLFWPPAVIDRATYPRLDAMRTAVGASNLADADRAFRDFRQPQAEQEATCAAIDRLVGAPVATVAAAFDGSAVEIQYHTPGLPISGTIHRLAGAELHHVTDGNALLGPFVGVHCADLVCDWFQGFCRRSGATHDGAYLWLSGRRSAPLWGVSQLAAH